MNERDIFLRAINLSPSDRANFLDQICSQNLDLRRRIELLIEQHEKPTTPTSEDLEMGVAVIDSLQRLLGLVRRDDDDQATPRRDKLM